MTSTRASKRRAVLAAFLLFAAALLAVGPVEASRTTDARSSLASISAPNLASSSSRELASLELSLLEPADSAFISSRFGFAEDLSLLDPKAGPGGFVVFARETSRCELTYARNNPLRFVDPDGKDVEDVVAGAGNAILSNLTLGGISRHDSFNSDYQKGQTLGDGASVLLGMLEAEAGGRVAAGGFLSLPESGGTTSVAVAGGAAVAAHGKLVATLGAANVLLAASNSPKSVNQINQDIKTGRAPDGLIRADKAKVQGDKDHVHLEKNKGPALNKDGSWRHDFMKLTRAIEKYLRKAGWDLPNK